MPEFNPRIARPTLNARQLSLLEPFGRVQNTTPGEVLFAPGDNEYPWVVILEGEVAIVSRSHGSEEVLGVLDDGQFLGELSLLTGQTAFLTARVETAGCGSSPPPNSGRSLPPYRPSVS